MNNLSRFIRWANQLPKSPNFYNFWWEMEDSNAPQSFDTGSNASNLENVSIETGTGLEPVFYPDKFIALSVFHTLTRYDSNTPDNQTFF